MLTQNLFTVIRDVALVATIKTMNQTPIAKVNVSVKILDFGCLESHEMSGSGQLAPQPVEPSEPKYTFPFATAPSDPVIVYPLVSFF